MSNRATVCDFALWISSAKIVFRVWSWSGHSELVGNTVLSPNTWYHVAGVFDRENNKIEIFINGVADGSTTTGGPPRHLNHPIVIGCDITTDCTEWFNGTIDEVAIHNRALTPEEIQQHYQNGLQGLGYEVVMPPGRPEPTVDMSIEKMEVDLENGKFEIKGYLDVSDPDFADLVLDPQSRMLLELQTGGTTDEPEFGIIGEDQVQLTTDDDWEELKFEAEEEE